MSALNRFNWIANSYDKLVSVVFGKTLHHAQTHFISGVRRSDKVLILGGGSGKFLSELLTIRPSVKVTYIEASSEMILLAKRYVHDPANVNFIHGTQDQIPQEQFDVVITNFFLDLFPNKELKRVIKTISKNLRVGGQWMVTDFENTEKFSHRILLSVMYLFFRITGSISAKHLSSWRTSFASEGLKLKEEKFFKNGFVSASVFVKAH